MHRLQKILILVLPTAQIKNAMPYWQKILTAIIAVLAALDVLAAVSLIYTSRKKVSEEGV